MQSRADSYAPGYGDDALAMLTGRTAATRADWFLPHLAAGMRILDVGCGPGTITLGLAAAVAPGGSCLGIDAERSQIDLACAAAQGGAVQATFAVGSAYDLPLADATVDAVFSHAVYEHLARPAEAAAELARVLRPGGLAGVCSSDWGGVRIEPRSDDVELAVHWHLELRRRAGGDPFAGPALPALLEAAGLTTLEVRVRHEVDMTYPAYARYIGVRLEAAAQRAHGSDRAELHAAAAAAARWATRDGVITQPWTAVVARRPAAGGAPA
jgi:SAM-dependent methyltransferase